MKFISVLFTLIYAALYGSDYNNIFFDSISPKHSGTFRLTYRNLNKLKIILLIIKQVIQEFPDFKLLFSSFEITFAKK